MYIQAKDFPYNPLPYVNQGNEEIISRWSEKLISGSVHDLTSLSIATVGCNFHYKFCQNWEISQSSPEDVYSYDVPPEMVVKKARETGSLSSTCAPCSMPSTSI